MKLNLRILYLYLFSAVGLIVVIFASISMVRLALTTYVFPNIDSYEVYDMPQPSDSKVPTISKDEQIQRQKKETQRTHQRQLADALSALLVGLPLYLYHWQTIQKESVKGTLV